MQISKLGEFGLIKRIKKSIRTDSSVIKGIGDDCAVIKFKKNEYLLYTCDMIVEGVDFTPQDDPYLVGRKSLAISISDIAACGGLPRYALVSLGLPKNFRLNSVDRIYKGINNLASRFKINIVGGDLSLSPKLVINVSLLGVVEKQNLVLRRGAKIKDIIFVTGNFGGSLGGKHLKFKPRLEEARFLVRNFKINSMIDASDGLIQDLGHILEESLVGAIIYENSLPLSSTCAGIKDALYTGEDFELIFTLSPKEAKRLSATGKDFSPIGRITQKKSGLQMVYRNGLRKKMRLGGFTHF